MIWNEYNGNIQKHYNSSFFFWKKKLIWQILIMYLYNNILQHLFWIFLIFKWNICKILWEYCRISNQPSVWVWFLFTLNIAIFCLEKHNLNWETRVFSTFSHQEFDKLFWVWLAKKKPPNLLNLKIIHYFHLAIFFGDHIKAIIRNPTSV